MGVLLVFLVSWRRGRYIGSDQQGDIASKYGTFYVRHVFVLGLRYATLSLFRLKPRYGTTVRLTSIDHPPIGGKFTATPSGLTNLFYGCKD